MPRPLRWKRRSGDEVRYWAEALSAADAREQFANRLDPRAPVDDVNLVRAIEELSGEEVKILDVGSGPLTSVGKTHPGRRLEIVAADPLADEYARVLREAGIEAPVVPVACGGEELVERFGPASFDVAYALNSLDHSADPMAVIGNMLTVASPGGRVALTHMRCEGERNGYFGIHFWNMDIQEGRFVVWNRDERHDVGTELAGRAEVEGELSGDWVRCLIRPLG
jgi:SAM-dependent methyltransferase